MSISIASNNIASNDVYSQLAEYTRIAKYAQYNRKEKRRETWAEQIERVFKMHKVKFYKYLDNEELVSAIETTKEQMLEKKIVGSQRALQFGGPAILKKNTRIYNCAATYVDRPRVFQEIMYALLCGTGVGFSVQKRHVSNLPPVEQITKGATNEIFTIDDTIEGWSDAIGKLLDSYFTVENKKHDRRIEFDYSRIRKSGSEISSCTGLAPGHAELENSLEKSDN